MDNIIAHAPYFLLVFIRVGAFMAFVPFFNNSNFFIMPMKEGFAFFLSLLLFPTLQTASWVIPGDTFSFMLMLSQEILIGILMALVFLILLSALQIAGHLLGFQMAFTMANVVDTTFGESTDVITVILVLVGTMLVISLGGDHYLIYSLGKSFDTLPPGSVFVSKALIKDLTQLMTRSFDMGFRLAAPAVILLLCIDVTLSLIGKAAAKIQIFFIGLPLKIAVGFFGLTIMLGFVVSIWGKEISKFPGYFMHFFKLLHI